MDPLIASEYLPNPVFPSYIMVNFISMTWHGNFQKLLLLFRDRCEIIFQIGFFRSLPAILILSFSLFLNAMPGLSKHIFLNTVKCPTLGWRLYNGKIREKPSPDILFRMEQGKKIGALARELHPDGVFVYASDNKTAASLTRELMEDPCIKVIFEGTFITGNYVAKADILIRNGDSWDLVEVKSVVNKSQDTIEDMAYTTLIGKNSGFVPATIQLQHINKEYRMGMPSVNYSRRWIARRMSKNAQNNLDHSWIVSIPPCIPRKNPARRSR